MSRQALIECLSRGLHQASGGRDWQALARLDAELATALRQWPAPAQWSETERVALQGLRRAHEQARLHCDAELHNLGQTLEQMRAGRTRWQAYAESNHWSDSAQDEKGLA